MDNNLHVTAETLPKFISLYYQRGAIYTDTFNKACEEYVNSVYAETESMSEATHSGYEECVKCGGRCCKNFPCALSPKQVEKILKAPITKKRLRKLLNSGKYSLDYYFTDGRHDAYFIRYKSKHAFVADEYYNGAGCINLTSSGCRLKFEERGIDAQLLHPVFDDPDKHSYHCDSSVNKAGMGVLWLPYRKMLEQLWLEFFHSGKK